MKNIIGIIIIIIGVAIGLWLGVYVMLYGGVIQIINGINPVNATEIATGVLKIILCELGAIPTYILAIIGMIIIGD